MKVHVPLMENREKRLMGEKKEAAGCKKQSGHFQTLWFTPAEWESVEAGFGDWKAAGRKNSLHMFLKSRILAEEKDMMPGREELSRIRSELMLLSSEMLSVRRRFEKNGSGEEIRRQIDGLFCSIAEIKEQIRGLGTRKTGGEADGDYDARPHRD